MPDRGSLRPHLILPVGTQVVSRVEVRDARGTVLCPAGAVGEVVKAPADGTHSYRVRLPDGREVSLQRQSLSIHKHTQRHDLEAEGAALAEHELWNYVIYRCVVGSAGVRPCRRGLGHRSPRFLPAAGRAALVALRRAGAARQRGGAGELLGDSKIRDDGPQGEPQCDRMPVHAPGRAVHAAGRRADREPLALPLEDDLSDLQRLCAVAIQEAGAGHPDDGFPQVEARHAPDPLVAGRNCRSCRRAHPGAGGRRAS